MNTSRRLQDLLRRVMPPVLALLIVTALAFVHLRRHYDVARLGADSLDTLQAARYYARTGQFGTMVVRPLITGFMPFRSDGTQPDLGHAPLYTILAGIVISRFHQIGPGGGDLPAVLVSLFAWVGSIVAVFLLARRLFMATGIAALAATLYAFASGAGLTLALTPHPATLAALFYPLLFLMLARLDRRQEEKPLSTRAAILLSLFAGVLYALLFLSVYSTLILLPIFLWYIARIVGKSYWARTLPVFLAAFLLLTTPYFVRNFQVTRNPLFNSRSLELIMQTETHRDYSLYRSATLNQSVGQYLTGGATKKSFVRRQAISSAITNGFPPRLVFSCFLLPWALA